MSAYLLDAHVFLWWLSDADRLSLEVYDIISDTNNKIYISSASIWEISIKEALGKLKIDTDLSDIIEANGFTELPISAKCAEATKRLEPIHRDPFDRMLIAQSNVHDLVLVTVDRYIKQYNNVKNPEFLDVAKIVERK